MPRCLVLACFVVFGCVPSRTSSPAPERSDAMATDRVAASEDAATTAVGASSASELDALLSPCATEATEVRDWGDSVVVRLDTWYEVDLASARLIPFEPPVDGTVLLEALRAPHPQVLVYEFEGRMSLYTRVEGNWSRDVLPESERRAFIWPRVLTSSTDATVVMFHDEVFVRDSDGWRIVTVDWSSFSSSNRVARNRLRGVPAVRWAFAKGRLWASDFFGEWGGALNALDLENGTWSEPSAGLGSIELLNPRSFDVDASGNLWMTSGLRHLSLIQGSLWHRDGPEWRLDTAVEGTNPREVVDSSEEVLRVPDPATTRRASPECAVGGWSFGTATFDVFAIDSEGRPCLAYHGLVRRGANGEWSRVTPEWPEDVEISGLVIHGSTAVIAARRNGVLLCDLDTGRLRRCE